jgi:N-acetylglucosaminyldiphosphoundecaprenol N-acetyl-beta-D-mannosaminyltransferase
MTRTRLLGLPLDLLNTEETLDRIEEMVGSNGVHQHVVLNAAKVVQAQHDDDLRAAIEACDVVNADGMSVVWAGRLLGVPVPERVAGIDLMEELLARAALRGWPVYLLGAREEVVSKVATIERQRHPGLIVAGYRNGYWRPEQEDDVVEAVVMARPKLLFVAMPSPKKEHFLARHKETLRVPFVMGVGGSFDVVAGTTSRAPRWMQVTGTEWVYRLIQEPRRMARRYAVGNTKFILLVLRRLFRTRLAVRALRERP